MRSSMQLSTLTACITGVVMAGGGGFASGVVLDGDFGVGVWGCEGLASTLGSWSEQLAISFDRSIAISEKRHHEGGFGDPLKVSQTAVQATASRTAINCAAALFTE